MTKELLQAVEDRDLDKVKELIEVGIDVNYRDYDSDWGDNDALMIAASNGHVEILKELLKAGANRLCFVEPAIVNQHPEIVQEWLKREPDINALDEDGDTLLWQAASGRLEIIQLLVEAGADVNFISRSTGESPLLKAVYANNREVVSYLWEHSSEEVRLAAGLQDKPS